MARHVTRAGREEGPVLAVTLGDPVGIGPEIVARTLADPPRDVTARGLAVGDAAVLRRAAEVCGLDVEVRPVGSVAQARFEAGGIDVLDLGIAGDNLPWGQSRRSPAGPRSPPSKPRPGWP